MTIKIEVRNNNVEKALRVLKKKLKKENIFQEMKDRQYYQKPSEIRRETKKQRKIAIKKAEKIIFRKGRLLVRKSGTESKIRIMCESEDKILLNKCIKIVSKSLK